MMREEEGREGREGGDLSEGVAPDSLGGLVEDLDDALVGDGDGGVDERVEHLAHHLEHGALALLLLGLRERADEHALARGRVLGELKEDGDVAAVLEEELE